MGNWCLIPEDPGREAVYTLNWWQVHTGSHIDKQNKYFCEIIEVCSDPCLKSVKNVNLHAVDPFISGWGNRICFDHKRELIQGTNLFCSAILKWSFNNLADSSLINYVLHDFFFLAEMCFCCSWTALSEKCPCNSDSNGSHDVFFVDQIKSDTSAIVGVNTQGTYL